MYSINLINFIQLSLQLFPLLLSLLDFICLEFYELLDLSSDRFGWLRMRLSGRLVGKSY